MIKIKTTVYVDSELWQKADLFYTADRKLHELAIKEKLDSRIV